MTTLIQRELREEKEEGERKRSGKASRSKGRGVFSVLRCFTAVVLDYWKQEMAVTGDETESGRVSLIHVFMFYVQKLVSFILLFLACSVVCMYCICFQLCFPMSILGLYLFL